MAKKYKPHEELGITFAEWGALFGFKAIAEAGIVLRTVNPTEMNLLSSMVLAQHPSEHLFNMGTTCTVGECGSVACIGGTVALFLGKTDPSGYVAIHEYLKSPLSWLYYPRWNNGVSVPGPWSRITVEDAGKATDNFLRTGKPNWDKVLGKKAWAAKCWRWLEK